MIVDCHVHISAFTPPQGTMSRDLLKSIPFRFMRWRLGIEGEDAAADRQLERSLVDRLEETEKLDAAVVLAFDAVYDHQGRRDDARTHLYVSNDYVIELARRHHKVLFGASVHPYRKDAVAEISGASRRGRCCSSGCPSCRISIRPTSGASPSMRRWRITSCRCCATRGARSRCRTSTRTWRTRTC